MYTIEIRSKALRQLAKLSPDVRKRIFSKLEYFCTSETPLSFAERLVDYEIGEYRFRVGDYRVIVDVVEGTIIVLKVGHRREIYK